MDRFIRRNRDKMISVVIPLYNAKDTIIDTVASVVNQTYKGDIEIVIINDGSTDGSEMIVEEYIKKNSSDRVLKLINKKNAGVSSARNQGIMESSGEWIALLDSDDIWLNEKLEKQITEIDKNPDIKFIGTNRNAEVYPFFAKSKNDIYTLNAKEIISKWHPHTSTALIRKEILLKTNLYDEARSHAEDGDLWLRVSQFCELYVLNKDLVYTGGGKRSFGESGLSANMPKMYEGEILALKGAKQRNQINLIEYTLFYSWLSLKYLRRKVIVGLSK